MKIKEDYVSFEVAKLLKEKGFDEKCQKVYMHNGQLLWAPIFMEGESFVNNKDIELVADYNDWITYTQGEYAYLCPTHQTVCKWLREVHNIFIEIYLPSHSEHEDTIYHGTYCFDIFNLKTKTYVYCMPSNIEFNSYEEAVEAALKYVLENLI